MISAVVLTFNEEGHLPDCLASLNWVDELLVLDSGSQDKTVEIARAAGARVEHRPFTHFGEQRQAALELVRHPWLFFVDADERVPPALAAEIQQLITPSPPSASGGEGARGLQYEGASGRVSGCEGGRRGERHAHRGRGEGTRLRFLRRRINGRCRCRFRCRCFRPLPPSPPPPLASAPSRRLVGASSQLLLGA